jgi:hypothetical protein
VLNSLGASRSKSPDLVKKGTRDGWVLNSLGAIRNKSQHLVPSYSTPQQSIYLGLFQVLLFYCTEEGS